MERRLTAILAADLVGYSRLVGEDEAGTLAALKGLRGDFIEPLVAAHRGRIVKVMGDGFLVAFSSAVDAVTCAIAWQEGMAARAHEKPLRFRIGVNLGDIVIEDGDIFGEGVNIAARLEGLSEAGGICISDMVHQNVVGKLDRQFEDLGEKTLKNIERKLRVWRWSDGAAPKPTMAASTASRPDKFSIAILPFADLSGDPASAALADGVTRDLITEIGKFSVFSVIAPGRGGDRPESAVEIGRRLGAQYLLEGSLQAAGPRIRVSIQVTDAETGTQVWSRRFDGNADDVFEFQDEVTQTACGQLYHPLMKHATARARGKPASGAETYDLYLQAFHHIERPTAAGMTEARAACEKVLDVDPGFALAYEHLAWINIHSALNGWTDDPEPALREARREALRGIAIDDKEGYLRSALGLVEALLGHVEKGLSESRLAVQLNPHDAEYPTFLGAALGFAGRLDEALAAFDAAERLSPGYPPIGVFKGTAYFMAGRPEDAVPCFERFLMVLPEFNWALACLAAAQVELDRLEQARDTAATIRAQTETMTRGYLRKLTRACPPAAVERLLAGLSEAGLPG